MMLTWPPWPRKEDDVPLSRGGAIHVTMSVAGRVMCSYPKNPNELSAGVGPDTHRFTQGENGVRSKPWPYASGQTLLG